MKLRKTVSLPCSFKHETITSRFEQFKLFCIDICRYLVKWSKNVARIKYFTIVHISSLVWMIGAYPGAQRALTWMTCWCGPSQWWGRRRCCSPPLQSSSHGCFTIHRLSNISRKPIISRIFPVSRSSNFKDYSSFKDFPVSRIFPISRIFPVSRIWLYFS